MNRSPEDPYTAETPFTHFRSPNERLAVVMSALALAGGLVGESRAQSEQAGAAAGIETVELEPDTKDKEKLLNDLASGKIPNRVLNLAVTFSVKRGDYSEFYSAPTTRKRGNVLLYAGKPAPRTFWIGQYPRYVHTKGEDWLMFDHTQGRVDRNSVSAEGPAIDMGSTYFLKASDMPDDTKIFSFSRGPINPAKRVLPAKVDKNNFIRVNGLPANAPQVMLGFDKKVELNGILADLGLVPSKIRSLENLR